MEWPTKSDGYTSDGTDVYGGDDTFEEEDSEIKDDLLKNGKEIKDEPMEEDEENGIDISMQDVENEEDDDDTSGSLNQAEETSTQIKWGSEDPSSQFYGMLKYKKEGKTYFECTFCKKEYQSTSPLRDHIANIHLNLSGRYVCHFCDKVYSSATSIDKHMENQHEHQNLTDLKNEITDQTIADTMQSVFEEIAKQSSEDINVTAEANGLGSYTYRDVAYTIEEEKLEGESSVKVFHCEACKESFKDAIPLQKHIRTKHMDGKDEPKLECPYCERKCRSKGSLYRHLSRNHDKTGRLLHPGRQDQPPRRNKHPRKREMYFDDEVERVLDNSEIDDEKSSFYGIVKMKIGKKRYYDCKFCSKRWKDPRGCRDHINLMHLQESKKRTYPCAHCAEVFLLQNNLGKHLQMKHPDRENKRKMKPIVPAELHDVANNLDVNSQSYGVMRRKEGNTIIYVCKFCEKSMVKLENLRQHIAMHHLEEEMRPVLMCHSCGKGLANRRSLNRHIALFHSGEVKKLNCDQCSFSTPLRGNLVAHVKSCHPQGERVRNFLCDQCPYQGFTGSDVRKHIKNTHTNKGAFPCTWPGCTSKFSRSEHLKAHLTRHTGERNHLCVICGDAYRTRWNLSSHMKQKHPDVASSALFQRRVSDKVEIQHAEKVVTEHPAEMMAVCVGQHVGQTGSFYAQDHDDYDYLVVLTEQLDAQKHHQ